ncbi:MAG: tRNA pseudouridine(38-40) synthase TruA [Steroidobacteraceae bacterium]
MARYCLRIEYDGSPFCGWQRQDNGPSVQGAIEAAIFNFSGEQVSLAAAGRTDAGVHALGQVAHFDLARDFAASKVRDALNHFLRPAPVAILDAVRVADDFHARFWARARHYRYRIVCRRAPLALERGRAWQLARRLDGTAMHEAAQALIGTHDFTTFRAAQCQARSPVRTLDRLEVTEQGDELWIGASARSFLHHQVRSMVGTLKLVGEGKWKAKDVAAALAAANRERCGPVAPADGLYLVAVDY